MVLMQYLEKQSAAQQQAINDLAGLPINYFVVNAVSSILNQPLQGNISAILANSTGGGINYSPYLIAQEQIPIIAERSVLETISQGAFDIFGQIRSAPNTLLGLLAGALSGGNPALGPGGTITFTNVDSNSLTGKIMSAIGGQSTMTLGYTIISKDSALTPDLEKHEFGHVTQSAILGKWYLPFYWIDHLIHPNHDDKWMESNLLPDWPKRR
jgi:hypothetical protein